MKIFFRVLALLILLGILSSAVVMARSLPFVIFDWSYFKTSSGIRTLLAWAFIIFLGPLVVAYLWRLGAPKK